MSTEKIRFDIEGMSCQACATRIEKVLNRNQNISSAEVNYANEEAQINFDNECIQPDEIIQLINKTGFLASIKTDILISKKTLNIPYRLILIWICTLPFLISMLGMLTGIHQLMLPPYWQFLFATIVQLFLATPFYKGAYASIKGGLANMDVLIVLGTTSIWLYSTYILFFTQLDALHHIYFEASVMVIAFISLGKYLELHNKRSSLNSISALLQLTPKSAEVWRNETWTQINYEDIQHHDLIRLKIGQRIPADGIVQEGSAYIDESHLTGESEFINKKTHDKVLAGSLVNDGSIIMQATQLGKETVLGDMIQALSDAQGSKAPIARIADQVAAIFVPIVVLIALLTFCITWWLTKEVNTAIMHAAAVLVIACPCALGLATPAAIMVGMGLSSKYGIWFKDAAAMEATAKIDTIVLDKTGTITAGKPKVIDTYLFNHTSFTETDLYSIAASVESLTTHPLSHAIVGGAQEINAPLLRAYDLQTQIGAGIQAKIENIGNITIGTAEFCQLNLPENLPKIWKIATIVAVSVNQQPIGAFALSDALRDDSIDAIQRLKEKNIEIYIMSGDKVSVVHHIAQQLNIANTHAYGAMSPRDKAEKIKTLIQQGRMVAMVGDGINDAPALAIAQVGFAMSNQSSSIAEQTAAATLMHQSISQVYDALWIAKATFKNIKQNLFFAFIYNIIGIPLAALGFLNPMLAGAAMALSSISVLGNALRLKKANPK